MNTIFTKRSFGFSVALLLAGQVGFAQISGDVTVGTGGDYPTLTGPGGLFETINTGGLNGNLSVAVISSIIEPGTTTLSQWTETPAASNFTLRIVPADATEKIISGAATAGMITLNGADRVYIDGSFAGSGRYLRFRNTSTGTGASTLALTADAKNDTIANCIIEGASSTTSTTNAGAVIYMGAGSSSGNDNNAFIGNIVKDIVGAANVPNFLLKSVNSTTAAASSDNNFIYNNEFANFATSGIYLGVTSGSNKGANNWTIRKNAYYQEATRTTALTCIQLNTGSGHLVDSNNIGGSAADRSGTPMQTSATPFYGIYVSVPSGSTTAATAIGVNSNNISNIYLSSTTGVFNGIYSVAYTKIQNNIIGRNNLPSDSIGNAGTSNLGIVVNPSLSTVSNIITGNSIRNMRSMSNSNVMSAGVTSLYGIFTIDRNTIDSISSGTGAVQTGGNALCGINISVVSGNVNSISYNSISNLILTHPTAISCAAGILTQNGINSGSFKIAGNNVSNIMGVSSNGNSISGIYENFMTGVSDSLCNNMVSLGTGTTSNSTVQGISDASNAATTHTYLNNTSVITGVTDAAANCNTTAFFRRNATTSSTLRNNIFVNLRTLTGTGTTGVNYAVLNNSTATTTSWKSDYNLMYNADPLKVVYWQPTATAYAFPAFKAAIAGDTNSVSANVPFVNLSNNNLHIDVTNADAWNVYGRGLAIAKVPVDIDSNTRSITIGTPTTFGADEITMPSTLPADMDINGNPTPGGTTILSSSGKKIAEIIWGASAPTAFTTAKYYPGVPAPNPTMAGPNLNSYFELSVTPDVSTYDYTIKTYYTTAEANGIADAAITGIKKHGNNDYVATNAAGTNAIDANGKYITSNILNDFSIFSMSGNISPLAINLATITAKNAGNQNKIEWTTASEERTDYFELERSTNASNFSKIASINAHGQASAYTYYDMNAATGINYYRLKMTHGNGTFTYSKVVAAQVKAAAHLQLNAYPNPATNKVNLKMNGTMGSNAAIILSDATGKTIRTIALTAPEMTIDISQLATGIFFIQYTDNQQTQTLKMMKQ